MKTIERIELTLGPGIKEITLPARSVLLSAENVDNRIAVWYLRDVYMTYQKKMRYQILMDRYRIEPQTLKGFRPFRTLKYGSNWLHIFCEREWFWQDAQTNTNQNSAQC